MPQGQIAIKSSHRLHTKIKKRRLLPRHSEKRELLLMVKQTPDNLFGDQKM
jgi:hypothetical protein